MKLILSEFRLGTEVEDGDMAYIDEGCSDYFKGGDYSCEFWTLKMCDVASFAWLRILGWI